VNTLVWWGDTIAPGIMPHQRRDNSIERIAEDVERYFSKKSGFYYAMDRDIGNYSARKLDGFFVKSRGITYAPKIEDLAKFTEGWYGVFACYQSFREDSHGLLRRSNSRYFSLVDVQGHTLVQNLMGAQYSFLMNDKILKPERFDDRTRLRLANYKKDGYFELANPKLVPDDLFRGSDVVVLESILVLELFKVQEAVE
jgi:hypothetical protein